MSETYLDNAATTPLDPEVLAAMSPFLAGPEGSFGNPSARCRRGVAAADAVDRARRQLARVLGAPAEGIVFTGGGTEANNLAVFGAARARRIDREAGSGGKLRGPGHILIGATEHPSVREAALALVSEGSGGAGGAERFEVEVAGLADDGGLDLDDLAARLRPETVLVAQMLVNNEFGTVYPVRELSRRVRARSPRAWLHVDAVQGLGKLELSLAALGADSLAISAHKLHGPQGVGALACAVPPAGSAGKGELQPLLYGGGQERGLRSGTENVAGIVGFGEAATRAEARRAITTDVWQELRGTLLAGLAQLPGVSILTPGSQTHAPLPSILAAVFAGPPAEVLMHHLEERGVIVSAGSACQASSEHISPALAALGLSTEEARRLLRISFSHLTTAQDIERLLGALREVRTQLARAASPAATPSTTTKSGTNAGSEGKGA
jgi:cysteine desulfurase